MARMQALARAGSWPKHFSETKEMMSTMIEAKKMARGQAYHRREENGRNAQPRRHGDDPRAHPDAHAPACAGGARAVGRRM
jgi:hypothetical protein